MDLSQTGDRPPFDRISPRFRQTLKKNNSQAIVHCFRTRLALPPSDLEKSKLRFTLSTWATAMAMILFSPQSPMSKFSAIESQAREALVYSYKHSFSGFAALLNSTQATTLSNMEGVISVFRSKVLQLHTTRSWDFMGLALDTGEATPLQLKYGDDVVVGIFDTGIWPESASFRNDSGLGSVPARWRGACVKGERFDPAAACNRKLVGARYYVAGFEREFGPLNATGSGEHRSARDRVGHGTHTASTAAGSVARGAGYLGGLGGGVARGGAPRARVAAYKVCWFVQLQGRCTEADIMAAFDDALRDGVGVISLSLGSSPPLTPLFATSTDVGAFHAAQMGVAVVFSAGNDGPDAALVENVSPWATCVAAGTIDRAFPTPITLGNTVSFVVSSTVAALAVLAANGSAMIFSETITKLTIQDDFLPTVHVDLHQGTQILDYIQSAGTSIGSSPAPSVAYFSSRGPSSISPNILKPDIAAPGVNILAAWPPLSSPTMLPFDRRSVNWNFESGTSMSCPHVSGIVALIKSAHPCWSPAAIRSALMTTAYMTDTTYDTILAGGTLKPVDPFDIGAGHVNPVAAMDPGLVYDIETEDYVIFLCSLGYTESQIKRMVLPSPSIDTSCSGNYSDLDLNYPAITISNLRSSITVKRTLRNVGQKNAFYFASVKNPQGVHAFVWPGVLIFTPHKEKMTYYVTVTPIKQSEDRYDFGEIMWSDGYHHVRTPLAVRVSNVRDGGSDRTRPESHQSA
ncbi:Subtilisin-like protease SBT3.3 [Ananas comosus]|uniref:Subtilisin-like protease SBT3.3 n=1 Tax=Ananas comosus TaxID=4615 RepID=A0A199W046_ANACO|nr:Subtilisin-like protease SBT3.3 [Ananas comosus]